VNERFCFVSKMCCDVSHRKMYCNYDLLQPKIRELKSHFNSPEATSLMTETQNKLCTISIWSIPNTFCAFTRVFFNSVLLFHERNYTEMYRLSWQRVASYRKQSVMSIKCVEQLNISCNPYHSLVRSVYFLLHSKTVETLCLYACISWCTGTHATRFAFWRC